MNRFKAAWNAFTGGNSVVKSATNYEPILIDPATHTTPDAGSWFWETAGTGSFYFKYSGHSSSLTAYTRCPPVNAIINRKAQAFINGKTFILNKKGKEATSEEATKIVNLLRKPNPLQNQMQFEAQGYIYQQLFGYNIILSIKPVGFKDNIDARSLWNIPPTMIDIEETNKLFYQTDTGGIIKEIVLTYKGQRTVLNVADLFIFKDITPSMYSLVLPESRICALELPINNIIGAYESRNVLINNRGPLGILTQEVGNGNFVALPMTKDQKDELQQELRRYGLKRRQVQYIVTNAALKWQSMGVATKDLLLFEEVQAGTMAVCDAYGYPYPLISSDRTNNLGGSNTDPNKKLLYQDTIIPEAESIYQQWNEFFKTETLKIRIEKDYSHVAVLQDDKVQSATARLTLNQSMKIEFENGLITLNDWLVKLGEDPLPDELGNVRATDVKNSNVPLAVTIGVGGVQGLIAVITAQGMSDDAKRATLEITFGIAPADAARMATSTQTQPNETTTQPAAAAT